MTQKEAGTIKPLSRFVEHFDMTPPTELLDIINEEDEKQLVEEQLQQQQPQQKKEQQEQQQQQQEGNGSIETKKPTPLYALPSFNRQKSNNSMSLSSTTNISTNLNVSSVPTASAGGGIRSYVDRNNNNKSPPPVRLHSDDLIGRNLSKSKSSPLLAPQPVASRGNPTPSTSTARNDNKPKTRSVILGGNNRVSVSNASSITASTTSGSNNNNNKQQQQQEYYNAISSSKSTLTSNGGGSTKKILRGRGLNRADIIMKRYESWVKFITMLSLWISDIAKHSNQSEKSFQSLLRDNKFSNFITTTGTDIDAANGFHATMHGFTTDLALQEQKFGRSLQKEHLPILEKFKKECTLIIKSLKSRPDLNLEEYFKRAEVTASLISQLTKSCKEARRTIEKDGIQVMTNDPWLVNLYVLRQLKREVDEENRLSKLMIPIQQSTAEFESRVLKAMQDALKVCFEKPGVLNEDQLENIQLSLNQAITNNWDAFSASNKNDIVNEKFPYKHYLNINYTCKNDPLVMTLHKGQLERRSGVLSKYTQRFYILTESGFLHQFKLNDKVSPEFSIYLPKSTIIPSIDISSIETENDLIRKQQEEQQQKQQQKKKNEGGYTFEIQRPGSVLQRDKSYVFRALSLEDMVIWVKLITEVATRTPETIPKSLPAARPTLKMSSSNAITTAASSDSLSLSSDSLKQQQEQQRRQESTPPPSPVDLRENRKSLLSVTSEIRKSNELISNNFNSTNIANSPGNYSGKPKAYTAQLNI